MIFLQAEQWRGKVWRGFAFLSLQRGGGGGLAAFGLPGCRSGFCRFTYGVAKGLNAHRAANNVCFLSSCVIQLWSTILLCVLFSRSSVNGSSKSSGNHWCKFTEAVWELAAKSKYFLSFPFAAVDLTLLCGNVQCRLKTEMCIWEEEWWACSIWSFLPSSISGNKLLKLSHLIAF